MFLPGFLFHYRKSDELKWPTTETHTTSNAATRARPFTKVRESVQQPEDSGDSEDREGVEDMDKLSDDEIVKQFRGRSLNQKLEIFKRVLRQSHRSFIKTWIEDMTGDGQGRLRQRKANQLLVTLYEMIMRVVLTL